MPGRRLRSAWLLVQLGLAAHAQAAELAVTVRDRDGEPLEHAVVYALPLDSNAVPVSTTEIALIDQIDKEFVPYVTAIRVGTAVRFPNKDQIRHHVYSFSPAKTFEIPLYKGTPAQPVIFDKPGAVALGCNIHDWMKAYVFVSDTPYFAVTQVAGEASIDLPSGDYAVEVWHPELKGEPASLGQRVAVTGTRSSLLFSLERKSVWAPRRSPSREGAGSYR